jgi:hypothetical protein
MDAVLALAAVIISASSILPINQDRGDGSPAFVEVTIYVTVHNYYVFNFNTGHVFISVKNPNSFSVNVGHYSLPANNTVFLGKWPNTFGSNTYSPYAGVNYNYESYLAHEGNFGNDGYSLTARKVDSVLSIFASASNYAISANTGYTLITDDCATFASTFFNYSAGQQILSVSGIPSNINDQIFTDEAHRFFVMPSDLPQTDHSFYYTGASSVYTSYPQLST